MTKHILTTQSPPILPTDTASGKHLVILGGCPFNRPLSGTKYPTRAAFPYPKRFYAEVIVTVFKTSQLCAVVRCCAQVLVEHCTVLRLFLTKQVTGATHVRNRVCPRVELILKIRILLLIIFLGFIKSKPC